MGERAPNTGPAVSSGPLDWNMASTFGRTILIVKMKLESARWLYSKSSDCSGFGYRYVHGNSQLSGTLSSRESDASFWFLQILGIHLVDIYIHKHIHTYTHKHKHTTCMCIYIYTCVCIHTDVHIYNTCTYKYTCMCVYLYT